MKLTQSWINDERKRAQQIADIVFADQMITPEELSLLNQNKEHISKQFVMAYQFLATLEKMGAPRDQIDAARPIVSQFKVVRDLAHNNYRIATKTDTKEKIDFLAEAERRKKREQESLALRLGPAEFIIMSKITGELVKKIAEKDMKKIKLTPEEQQKMNAQMKQMVADQVSKNLVMTAVLNPLQNAA